MGTGLALAAGAIRAGIPIRCKCSRWLWTLAAAVVFLFASGMAAAYLPARVGPAA